MVLLLSWESQDPSEAFPYQLPLGKVEFFGRPETSITFLTVIYQRYEIVPWELQKPTQKSSSKLTFLAQKILTWFDVGYQQWSLWSPMLHSTARRGGPAATHGAQPRTAGSTYTDSDANFPTILACKEFLRSADTRLENQSTQVFSNMKQQFLFPRACPKNNCSELLKHKKRRQVFVSQKCFPKDWITVDPHDFPSPTSNPPLFRQGSVSWDSSSFTIKQWQFAQCNFSGSIVALRLPVEVDKGKAWRIVQTFLGKKNLDSDGCHWRFVGTIYYKISPDVAWCS